MYWNKETNFLNLKGYIMINVNSSSVWYNTFLKKYDTTTEKVEKNEKPLGTTESFVDVLKKTDTVELDTSKKEDVCEFSNDYLQAKLQHRKKIMENIFNRQSEQQ